MKKAYWFLMFVFLSSCASVKPAKENITIITREAWKAQVAKPFKQHKPVRITVHHEGTFFEAADAAAKIKAIQVWGMGADRKWADIPYHFLISPGGNIYEGRNVFTVGETNTEYDPAGHLLISCLGNYEKQEVSPELLESLINTIVYASRKYNIDISTLSTHRDNSKQTTCPGRNLYAYFENGYIRSEVEKRLKSN